MWNTSGKLCQRAHEKTAENKRKIVKKKDREMLNGEKRRKGRKDIYFYFYTFLHYILYTNFNHLSKMI